MDPASPPATPSPERKRNRILIATLRWIVALVVVGCLVLAIRRAVLELQSSPESLAWSRIRWSWGLAGLFGSLAALLPSWIGWHQVLRDFHKKIPWRHSFFAYFLGHLGKYVPGKAMAVLLRVGYLHRLGALVRPSIVSVFIETLTSIAIGSILGAVLLQSMSPPPWLRWIALLGIPFALAALVPNTFRALVTAVSKSRIGRMPEQVAQAITWRMMLRTSLWSALGWLLHGTAGWILLMAISPDPSAMTWNAWRVCVTSMCLGNLAGFMSMLPGGAGVRELVTMWLMTEIVPEPVALAAAVVTRLAVMLAEGIMLAIATWICPKPE